MLRYLAAAALLSASSMAHAQAEELSLEHRMLLRCAATAAMVAAAQEAGDPKMADYPDMRERGREFFIRTSVQVMDEARVSRETVEARLFTEARDIRAAGTVHQMMPVCLPLVVQSQ